MIQSSLSFSLTVQGLNLSRCSLPPAMWKLLNLCPVPLNLSVLHPLPLWSWHVSPGSHCHLFPLPPVPLVLVLYSGLPLSGWPLKSLHHMCWFQSVTFCEWWWRRVRFWLPVLLRVCGSGGCVGIPGLWPLLLLSPAGQAYGADCLQHLLVWLRWSWTTNERRSLSACCAACRHRLIRERRRVMRGKFLKEY